ncbi:hypothetical protein TNCV_2590961 [Trichonephila clavipes]|nr:hypothetical protein TNCV_2590961 [Trichonephila clavipes]
MARGLETIILRVEFHRLKKQRYGPMSKLAFKDMMVEFEKREHLGIFPGRRRKRVNTTVVGDIATAVVEANSEPVHGTINIPTISNSL